MKKINSKKIPCSVCSGKSYIEMELEKAKDNNTITTIYAQTPCKSCNGKGVLIVDNLTYNLHFNKIRAEYFALNDMLKNKQFSNRYEVTNPCENCLGLGVVNECDDFILNKEHSTLRVNRADICPACGGKGHIFNLKKTIAVVNNSLKLVKNKIDRFIEIQSLDDTNLKVVSINRSREEILRDKRLNICLNCKVNAFSRYLHESPICTSCCYCSIDKIDDKFVPIDRRSKLWYHRISKI